MKKIKNNQKGSILVLTLLALVSALSIAVALSTVSIIERKMTTKSRKSVTAFQVANSGVEWAMQKINNAGVNDTVETIFGDTASSGEVSCPTELFPDKSSSSCKIVLLQRNTSPGAEPGSRVKINSNIKVGDIVAIRSRGYLGSGSEEVGRALEAYAMPNCGASKTRVGDFCVDKSINSGPWTAAAKTCVSGGGRLCTAAELYGAGEKDSSLGIGNSEEWTGDLTGSTQSGSTQAVTIDGDYFNSASITDNKAYRCCRNR